MQVVYGVDILQDVMVKIAKTDETNAVGMFYCSIVFRHLRYENVAVIALAEFSLRRLGYELHIVL